MEFKRELERTVARKDVSNRGSIITEYFSVTLCSNY